MFSDTYEQFKDDGKTPRCQGTATHRDSMGYHNFSPPSYSQCSFQAKYDGDTHCKIHCKEVEDAKRAVWVAQERKETRLAALGKALSDKALDKLLTKHGV